MQTGLREWVGWKAFDLRHFIVACCVGVAIKLVLLAVAKVSWLPHVPTPENFAFDAMMRMHAAGSDPLDRAGGSVPFLALIDIDDRTYRSPDWGGGEPAQAPRDALIQLIERAFDKGAQQVVLDVLIESGAEHERESAVAASGAAALDALTRVKRDAQDREDQWFAERLAALFEPGRLQPQQRLILVRSLRHPPRVAGVPEREMQRLSTELRHSRQVDEVVRLHPERIRLAAPYFRTSRDGVLREWVPTSVACMRMPADRDAPPRWQYAFVDSVQMQVLEHWGEHQQPKRRMPWVVEEPQPKPAPAVSAASAATLAGTPVVAPSARSVHPCRPLPSDVPADSSDWQRIEQQFPTPERKKEAVRQVELEKPLPLGNLTQRVIYRFQQPATTIPALDMLRKPLAELPGLTGAIVVIGQTHSDSPDHHYTPLGLMAGANVLLNAIDSLARYDDIVSLPMWPKLLVVGVLVVVMSYVYSRVGTLTGSLVVLVGVMLLLVPGSYWLFKSGQWLDYALPVLGIFVHAFVGLIEERGAAKAHGPGH